MACAKDKDKNREKISYMKRTWKLIKTKQKRNYFITSGRPVLDFDFDTKIVAVFEVVALPPPSQAGPTIRRLLLL